MNKIVEVNTPGAYHSVEDLTTRIGNIIRKTAQELNDSPVSKATQINNHIGFAMGYAQAKGWDIHY